MPEKQPDSALTNAHVQQSSDNPYYKNNKLEAGVFADQVKSPSVLLQISHITLPKGGGALKGID